MRIVQLQCVYGWAINGMVYGTIYLNTTLKLQCALYAHNQVFYDNTFLTLTSLSLSISKQYIHRPYPVYILKLDTIEIVIYYLMFGLSQPLCYPPRALCLYLYLSLRMNTTSHSSQFFLVSSFHSIKYLLCVEIMRF